MKAVYHEGEIEVQTRAGVRAGASRIGNSIRSAIPPVAQDFLRDQSMVVLSSVDANGRVWASLLTGEPGFVDTLDEDTIKIAAEPVPGDPLSGTIREGAAVGMLAIDLATRRRMRINGQILALMQGQFLIHTEQVYANCPKYIQTRLLEDYKESSSPPRVKRGLQLTIDQQLWIEQADTFFIATAHPTRGADASHRGGLPGFISVLGANKLIFPDYAGNTMFQTLGNISVNPRAGLLFIDFAHGSTLQVAGTARILWDDPRTADFPGAQRLVEVDIDEVVEIAHATPLRGRLIDYSPFNPE